MHRSRESTREVGWGRNWARGVSEWVWAIEKGSGAGVLVGKCAVVGASTTEGVGGRLGKRRGLMGGVRGQRERELANGRSALAGRVRRTAGENGRGSGRIGADRSAPLGSEREREKLESVGTR
jgi:hypothetical protein